QGTTVQFSATTPPATMTTTLADPAVSAFRSTVGATLNSAVDSAETRYDGTAEAAVWVNGWDTAVISGDEKPMRMWSMFKPVVTLALLKKEGPVALEPLTLRAIPDAIERSDNCAAHRLVLELQRVAGSAVAARRLFTDVLSAARARATVPTTPVTFESNP